MLQEIGEAILERTLSSIAESKSPVSGYGNFKSLSKDYREFKQDEVGSRAPDLAFSGDMISSLDFKTDQDALVIGVFGLDAPKADGHNNLSGKSRLPTRRFIPDEGESYKSDITKLVDDIIRFYKAENQSEIADDLEGVETKSELYDVLEKYIGDYSRAKLKQTVLGSGLAAILEEYDLLDKL